MDIVSKSTGDQLTASEFNQIVNELEQIITDAGIALSIADLAQISKAISNYVAGGDYYTDSGIADAYVLTPVGSKKGISAYADGMQFDFAVGNTNTGASTVNVNSIGVKDIKKPDNTALNAGDLSAGAIVRVSYDNSAGNFKLISATNYKNFISVKSADYTIIDNDSIRTIEVNETTATRTITLPTAAANTNRIITIKNTSTQKGIVTVDGEGAETIDGYATIDLDFKQAYITVQSNGTGWNIISQNLTAIQKQYTITVSGTTWVTTVATARPYRDIEGNWFVETNITGTFTAAVTRTVNVSGLSFSGNSALTGASPRVDEPVNVYSLNGTNIINMDFTGPALSTTAYISGCATLSAKPTFVE